MKSPEAITNGDVWRHQIQPSDPEHVKALKRAWVRLADQQANEEQELKRLDKIANSWNGQRYAAHQRLQSTFAERVRIEEALKRLTDPAPAGVGEVVEK